MKICFISYEYPPNVLGGVGTYAKIIADGLMNRGIDLHVITKGYKCDIKDNIYSISCNDSTYWRRLFFMKNALKMFRDLYKIHKFDIVHFNEPHFIYSKLNVPTISSIHSNQLNELLISRNNKLYTIKDIKDILLKNTIGSVTDFITAHKTDKIICPSPHLANLIQKYYLVEENKVTFIPNGIDLKSFDNIKIFDEENILNKYNLSKNNYLLYMGRLSHLKGVHHLINVFRYIKEIYNDMKLVIAGRGEQIEELYLKKLASYSNDIIFTGYIDSLSIKKTLYKNSLVVILPSLYEGLSMVLLEAMACKKPIIACDVGGNSLLIKQGKNGFLFKPGDNNTLNNNINELIENNNLSSNMGNYSRKLVESKFSSKIMFKELINTYNEMINI